MNAPAQRERWLKIVANLRVDRNHNIAPHKPLLLLVVADLAGEGALTTTDCSLPENLSSASSPFGQSWPNAASRGPTFDCRSTTCRVMVAGCHSMLKACQHRNVAAPLSLDSTKIFTLAFVMADSGNNCAASSSLGNSLIRANAPVYMDWSSCLFRPTML